MDGVTGELMAYGEEWLNCGCVDGVMNYYFRETVLGLASGEVPVAQAAYNFKRMARHFNYDALLRSWNLLSSHDTPRLASVLPDAARRKFAFTLAFVVPGTPMIYYGEEIGMRGGRDPENRGAMNWNAAEWESPILHHIRKLAELRRTRPALLTGRYVPMPQPGAPSLLCFARVGQHPEHAIFVVANASDSKASARVFAPYSYLFDGVLLEDLLGHSSNCKVSSGTFSVNLEPWSVALFSPVENQLKNYNFYKEHAFPRE
jgi:alpha-glucosidase